jgi:RND family efflux transporter MFP subunit
MGTTVKSLFQVPRKIYLPLLALLLILIISLGFVIQSKAAQTSATPTPGFKTAVVRRGNIVLSATGSGTLVAGQEAQLSFPVAGKVAKINVQVGDKVTAGQVLAELADLTSLQAAVKDAELQVTLAENDLQSLYDNAAANLANAKLALAEAQKAYDDAKSKVKQKGYTRCDKDTIQAYYDQYVRLKEKLDEFSGQYDSDFYLTRILPLKNQVATAYANYTYCLGYTDYEIETSQANLAIAEANLKQAQAKVDTLEKNNGIDPVELAKAQSNLENTKLALEKARQNLDGAVMKAPFDGVITAINGQVGDSVNAGATFITLADLFHPIVEFAIDETDMDKAVIGAEAEITFDALPDRVFKGTVIRLNPTLETVNGYQVLKGAIRLEMDANNQETLLEGLNATVTIITARAENVLVVPIEALRDLGDGQYAVFVVGADGQPRLTVVEVGLKDSTYAEIKSGLNLGDVVTTGNVETQG